MIALPVTPGWSDGDQSPVPRNAIAVNARCQPAGVSTCQHARPSARNELVRKLADQGWSLRQIGNHPQVNLSAEGVRKILAATTTSTSTKGETVTLKVGKYRLCGPYEYVGVEVRVRAWSLGGSTASRSSARFPGPALARHAHGRPRQLYDDTHPMLFAAESAAQHVGIMP